MKLVYLLTIVLFALPLTSALTLDVLSTNPAPLQAGEFADITFEIRSDLQEQEYNNLKIDIRETNYLEVVSFSQDTFETFRAGRSAVITARVFINHDLPDGMFDIFFVAQSDNFDEKRFTRRLFIQQAETLPDLRVGMIRTTPNKLLADTTDNEVVVTLQNLGNTDAKLVRAELLVDEEKVSPSFSFSLEDNVASIPAGQEAQLRFTLDIEENVMESVPATLQLRYRARMSGRMNYESFTTQLPVQLELVPTPFLEISSVEQLSNFRGGTTENRMRVGITNTGQREAREVRVRIIPDISYPFIFSSTTQYVSAQINPGETQYVFFETEVTRDAEDRDYTVTVRLESLVGQTRYARETFMSVETRARDPISTSTIATIIILLVVVLAVIVGLRARKRK